MNEEVDASAVLELMSQQVAQLTLNLAIKTALVAQKQAEIDALRAEK